MKTLYIECNMGAAGDMLMAALSETAPAEAFERIAALDIPNVEISREKDDRFGIAGTHVKVLIDGSEEGHEHHEHHEHHHHSLTDIEEMISGLNVSEQVKIDARGIYLMIADAESKVHGCSVSEVHFHEVGAMDAVADVVGNCMLMEAIGADRIVVSPVNVGSGTVKCAHGILPVPAPATCEILKDAVYYSDDTRGELCTPTGAAILQYFADAYGERPVMKVSAVGVGTGTRDFSPKVNCVRVFLGDDGVSADDTPAKICQLSANIDDMTGEELGFAMEMLLAAGALDVYFVPIVMKKSRPAVLLSCICRMGDADKMAAVMFRHTRTCGIRRQTMDRYVLDRSESTCDTPDGTVRIKTSRGYGVERSKAEYDDLAEIAKKTGKSLDEVKGEKL